jgi:GMP synthase (glutamine-hydrolysing)
MVETDAFIDEAVAGIREEIGDAEAVIALSGGVDSSVAATLAYEAVGDQLTPVYVDTGLMRKGETDQVRETFSFMESLRVVDAADRFFDRLAGVTDPEAKRHAIGEGFIDEFETVAREVDADYLVQGTIYPDRIESEGNIKSHHNVGGLPEVVDFDGIVEPVRDLYKDEVREVARALDLEAVIAERMPFPGPGLAVRVVGEVTPEKAAVAREACHVVEGVRRRDREGDRGERRQPGPRLGGRGALCREPRRDDGSRTGDRLEHPPADPKPDHRRERKRRPGALRRHTQAAGDDRIRVMTETHHDPWR